MITEKPENEILLLPDIFIIFNVIALYLNKIRCIKMHLLIN